MKIVITFFTLTLFVLACSDDSDSLIDMKAISGIWVPYEIRHTDGTIEYGPFTARSVFGAYDESVQLNSDKTFVPVWWINKDEYGLSTGESGKLEYSIYGRLLLFTGGSWEMEFEITKYGEDELWLTYKGGEEWNSLLGDVETQYRLRREVGK